MCHLFSRIVGADKNSLARNVITSIELDAERNNLLV